MNGMVPIALSKVSSRVIPRRERKKAAEIVSGLSGKNTCLMKSSPLPRMLLQAWRGDEPKWSRKMSSAERNNCDVTAAPQVRGHKQDIWVLSAFDPSCPNLIFAVS
jgi:hypothetical protein